MSVLSTFYDQYHQKNDAFFKVIGENNFTYFYTLQFLRLACPRGFKRQKVLDIGCGVGTLSLYLATKDAVVQGIDISPRAVNIATQAKKALNLRSVSFKLGELKKGTQQHDLVICSEVIEHIKNDTHFLQLISSNLTPEGKLFLSTPSSDNLLYRSGFYKKFDQEVGHLRRYTETSLSHLLVKNGFRVLKIRSVEGPLRNILFTTKLGFVIRFIKGPLVPLFHHIDQLTALIFGASDIQVIAQKNSGKR